MSAKFKAFTIIYLVCLLVPIQALASRPVPRIIVGCVIDGMLFALDDAKPLKNVNLITVVPPLNLTPYEGKKIRLQGALSPGDRFRPDMAKGIKVLGACDQEARAVIRKELPWAYKAGAEEAAENNDWSKAWKFINKAIKLESSNCSLYLTRAKFSHQQGKLTEALADAQRAVDLGCREYPNWAFLGELLETAGKKSAAIDAYAQAVRICGYKPDREKFQQKIDHLKGINGKTPNK